MHDATLQLPARLRAHSVGGMDYHNLIDAEIWAFIRETESHYPADTAQAEIATQRAIYNRMCRAFFAGYPKGVQVKDGSAHGVPIRVYEPTAPGATVVYFHGGGFVVGGLDSHDDICAEICVQAQVRVVSVEYRLCPEHPHPAAFEDALTATKYMTLTWPGTLVLAGDSAGGNLAAAVAHSERETLELAGQVLIYPGLGGDKTQGSYRDHAHAPMLTLADVNFYETMRFGGAAPTNDATAAPLADTDFTRLPPTVIFTAECDPLADDGRIYRDAIRAAGGKARWVNEAGLVHGYLRARHRARSARDSFQRIVAATKMLAEQQWRD